MVLATKVFVLEREMPLAEIAHRLKGYGITEREEVLGRTVEVGSRIEELEMEGDMLVGTFEEDFLISTLYRGEAFRVPLTVRTCLLYTSPSPRDRG